MNTLVELYEELHTGGRKYILKEDVDYAEKQERIHEALMAATDEECREFLKRNLEK